MITSKKGIKKHPIQMHGCMIIYMCRIRLSYIIVLIGYTKPFRVAAWDGFLLQ